MKLLAFSDWRIQPHQFLTDIVAIENPDAILYAGDDLDRLIAIRGSVILETKHGRVKVERSDHSLAHDEQVTMTPNQKRYLVKKVKDSIFTGGQEKDSIISSLGIPFFFVNGNDDEIVELNGEFYLVKYWGERLISKVLIPIRPRFGNFLIESNGESVKAIGCQCTPGLGSRLVDVPSSTADIYLSHIPPLGHLDLAARFGVEHIGSKALLDAIHEHRPRVVICGHSHIWGGLRSEIDETQIINVSSSDRDASTGNYAMIDTDGWDIEIKKLENRAMRPVRGLQTVKMKVSKIRGQVLEQQTNKEEYEEKRLEYNGYLGILNPWIKQDHYTMERRLTELDRIEALGINVQQLRERICSLSWNEPVLKKRFTLDPRDKAFLDVETGMSKENREPGDLWLIGIEFEGELQQFHCPEEIRSFKEYLSEMQIKKIVIWTQYDVKVINRSIPKGELKVKFIDACQRVSNCLIWNTYKLDELYHDLFPGRIGSHDGMPGYIAGLYADHLILSKKKCPHCSPVDKIISDIEEKNRTDIDRMKRICERIWDMNDTMEIE